MGNWIGYLFEKEPPPPMVLVPPMFDFPPLAARTRSLSLSLSLSDNYSPLDSKTGETLVGNALFRWQRDLEDPHTFVDLFVSNSEQILNLRTCAYYPKYGIGAFGIFPLLKKKSIKMKKKRKINDNLFVLDKVLMRELCAVLNAVSKDVANEIPRSAWVVSKIGKLTAGALYKPDFASKDHTTYNDVKNWSWAIGYSSGSSSPLSPSYNFGLEFARSSQQHCRMGLLCLAMVLTASIVEFLCMLKAE
ncbi:hypothetical protein ACLOJK_032469 [Asimina triloba]